MRLAENDTSNVDLDAHGVEISLRIRGDYIRTPWCYSRREGVKLSWVWIECESSVQMEVVASRKQHLQINSRKSAVELVKLHIRLQEIFSRLLGLRHCAG